MPLYPIYPVSTTWSVLSGDLSTLNRISCYGVPEPNVSVDTPVILNSYEFVWDFIDYAVHVTQMWHEMSLLGGVGFALTAFGSNDGTTWDAVTVSISESTHTGTGDVAVFRHVSNLTTDKFFRYFKMVFTVQSLSYSGSLDLRFQTASFSWDSSRPYSEDGHGGVGPGTDGGGGGANDPGGINDPSTHEGFAMSDLAVYAGDMVLDWIKGNEMGEPPANVYVALFDGDPDDPDTPGVELTDGTIGLTRQEVTFGSVVARYMLNTNKLNFGNPTEEITVACFCVYDADEDGNRITKKMLTVPSVFGDDVEVIIQPGKLPVYY